MSNVSESPITRGERRKVAKGEKLDDSETRKHRQAHRTFNYLKTTMLQLLEESPATERDLIHRTRAEWARRGQPDPTARLVGNILRQQFKQGTIDRRDGFLHLVGKAPGLRVVGLPCGHTATVKQPHRHRTCAVCGVEKQTPEYVMVNDDRVDIDTWNKVRRALHAHAEDERERRNQAKAQRAPVVPFTAHAATYREERERIANLARIALSSWDEASVLDAAHNIYSAHLIAPVVSEIRQASPRLADMFASILDSADSGVIPERAWYAQYGARAISQTVAGKPSATTADLR